MPALAITAAMVVASAGYADVVSVTPRVVVVEQDATPMRCGSGMPFYAVGMLNAGERLRVDGEDGGWLRVEYLTDMLAFVKAEEAALESDGAFVRLTRPSRLAAVNERGNERGHWWSLLETALPADSRLRVQQTVKAMNEVTTGYLVVAPAQSRGYVRAESVREATKEEAVGFRGRTDIEPQRASSENSVALDAGGASGKGAGDAGTPGADGSETAVAVHDLGTLRTRYAQVMALKGEDASRQIPVVIAELKRTAATLGGSKEDLQMRSAINRSIAALQLRQDILSTIKACS